MDTIRNVVCAHSKYWECFKHSILDINDDSLKTHYNFFDKKPEIYQTRNMYPIIDTTHVDTVLSKLIMGK